MDLYIHTYIWKCELILYLTYFTYNETSKMHLALSQAYALMWMHLYLKYTLQPKCLVYISRGAIQTCMFIPIYVYSYTSL